MGVGKHSFPIFSVRARRVWYFCVDVALATSAAPTYFPVCEIPYFNSNQYIDGGVWANNPTMVGLIEALKYFVGDGNAYDALEILSVSSLTFPRGKPIGRRRSRSFIGWQDDLFETSLAGQNYFTHHFMERLTQFNNIKINYVRIPSEEISSEQKHLVKLDLASKSSSAIVTAGRFSSFAHHTICWWARAIPLDGLVK